MTSYGENYGKGMLIGCVFTLIMTLGTLPMLLPVYEGRTAGALIIIASYVLLGLMLAFLGVKFRKEKNDSMPEVYGTAVFFVGCVFVIIGAAGLIANYAVTTSIGYQIHYTITIILGIMAFVFGRMAVAAGQLEQYKIPILITFIAMMGVSVWGIAVGISSGEMIGMPMFNTLMISLVFTVFALKGGPAGNQTGC